MMKGADKVAPPSGYFILEYGQLLTADPTAFPGATVVSGPSADETLAGAEKCFDYWKEVLAHGVLPTMRNNSPGPAGDDGSRTATRRGQSGSLRS